MENVPLSEREIDDGETGALLEAIGNSCRRRILELLVNEPHYVSQIAKILQITQPAVLKQMNVLKDSGLVEEVPQRYFTREKMKGAVPMYFRVKNSFMLTFSLSPYSIRKKKTPLSVMEGDDATKDVQGSLLTMDSFADRISFLNMEIKEISTEIETLETGVVQLEEKKQRMLRFASELIIAEEDLKKDCEASYLQRLILKKQLCQNSACVTEIERMLRHAFGAKIGSQVDIAVKNVQDKKVPLNLT